MASQPNLWLSTVLGLTEDGNTQGVRAWGLGIGLVDCLLDVEEDLRIGKLYFPLEDLRRCRVGPADIERAVSARCVTEPLHRLISLQVGRAVRRFATAEDWARQCRAQEGEIVLQSIARARHILDRIEQNKKSIFEMPGEKAV
ncbi:squalene/phytoene synthase family protein [Streptomyces yerevanensis]|uniref:squalene/phytoene synthase family protein n=1 Tax=Streptomyces yerevanensis TaxID=66378 RepID=UPI000527155D|nr:squalene/phytoene synthase family protein [Streptomyces yerevanensis]